MSPFVRVTLSYRNWEGAVVDRVQLARTDGTDGIVLNPGGWTHYSVAIRDALLGVSVPYIEVRIPVSAFNCI